MAQAGASLRTLLVTDLVDSTRLVERLGDARASELFARHDRLARQLLTRHGGREIDKTDGFLALFERPIHAVSYALAYHEALEKLEADLAIPLRARAAIHLGEVILRENPAEEVAKGAKPVEVEGIAKPVTARLMSLGGAGQTLLSRAAFDLARRAAADEPGFADQLRWLAHGSYLMKGIEDPVEVFEVGIDGHAPLVAPTPSDKARRLSTDGTLLGWRPAPGLDVPHRPHWAFVRKLGEGGFGEVWLAQHRKTHDHRVMKFCFDLARVRALQREVTLCRVLREALGDRPDIVRILDWNFEEPPYFLEFEHTQGGSLLDWAERQGGIASVPMALRLELVAQVADAVSAAHSVGILHKDIKPANVIVAQGSDGRPHAQVTDFGIGLLTDRSRLGELGITAQGMTATASDSDSGSGTRLYMAPEILEGKAATIQADVYSLGVLAYQCAVGDFARSVAPGWEREVADEVLREDLAALLDGRPERRVASAAEVSARLRSIDERRARRADEARARASAESTRLSLEKSRRRWRLATAIGAAVVLVAVLVAVQARRIAREASRANREAEVARQVTDFLVSLFQVTDPSEARGNSVTAREILDRGAERIDGELAEQPLVRAELMTTMGIVYQKLGLLEPAARLLEGALTVREKLLGRQHAETAESYDALGILYLHQGKLPEAEAMHRKVLAIRERTLGPDHPDVARTLNDIAWVYQEQARFDDARKIQERALAILKRDDPGSDDVAESLITLAGLDFQQARPAEAKALLVEALALQEALYGKEHVKVASTVNDVGVMCRELGQLDEAERCYLRTIQLHVRHLGPDHPDLGTLLNNLAAVASDRGDNAAAESLQRQALSVRERGLGGEHPLTAFSLTNLAYAIYLQDRPAEAALYLEPALQIRERTLGPDHPRVAVTASYLGLCRLQLGQLDAAEALLCRSLDVRERTLRPEHQDLLTSLEGLAAVMRAAGRAGEAEPLEARAGAIRRALADRKERYPPLPPIRPPA